MHIFKEKNIPSEPLILEVSWNNPDDSKKVLAGCVQQQAPQILHSF